MSYYLLCAVVFLLAYTLNIFYITVFYHRGLAHGAVTLKPWLRRTVVCTGNWVTGLDPKGWSCMHRLHHMYSDTPQDPHSPVFQGVFPLLLGQLHSYNTTLVRLIKKQEPQTTLMRDLDFPVNWLNRNKLWFIPYAVHAAIAAAVGFYFHTWLLAYCYWAGIMSHPIQGWMVNALAHTYGYRNFDTPDNSRNNTMVALLVAGEGYQNNHHQAPKSARFSARGREVDWGYFLCRWAERFHLLDINGTRHDFHSSPSGHAYSSEGGRG